MIKNIITKHVGFTIAEVLITLGIIGVVAALTLPSLINNVNQQDLYTSFRKHYAEISQATTQVVQEAGGALTSEDVDTASDVIELYRPYLKFIKVCTGNSTALANGGCWNSTRAAYRFDNGADSGLSFNGASAVLPDGSYFFNIGSWSGSLNCNDASGTRPECTRFALDVNGNKRPNTIGKDIFVINLHQKRLGIGSPWNNLDQTYYGGDGAGMTGYCLINKCPP